MEVAKGGMLAWIQKEYEGKKVTGSRSEAGNWMEFTLEHIEKGRASLLVPVKHEMTNPYGNIHGGMMSLVIDEAIGWAVVSLDLDTHYTSMNLNVDFLYAIKEGETLKAVAEVVRHGKKIIHAECSVYDMKHNLLARASSNLIATSMQIKDGEVAQ